MELFGHIAVTLGSVALLNSVFHPRGFIRLKLTKVNINLADQEYTKSTDDSIDVPHQNYAIFPEWMDLRILILGSLLPDIIDKPVGIFIFPYQFGNGRIFCHTLLFLLLISVAGILLKLYGRKLWLATLSIGDLCHLILDQMWLKPYTLFWPLFGFNFPKGDVDNWLTFYITGLFRNPREYIPEIVCGLVLLVFAVFLVSRRKIWSLMKTGQLG